MNRSILIVICDFLLISLLAFSTVDINQAVNTGGERPVKLELAATTNQVESGQDLTAVMRLALEEERKRQDQLIGELTRSREAANKQQALLGEREKQAQTFQQQALQLQQQQTNLEQRFAAAQGSIQTLSQQLQSTSAEAASAKEKLAAVEAEARTQLNQDAALQQQLAMLAKSNQMTLAEKQQLASRLAVAEAEKRSAAELAARMEAEVKVERQEKSRLAQHAEKLAEDVSTLANKSGELAKEVRENRPLAPNAIFNEFASNRVDASFYAFRTGFLGDTSRRKETGTVLVTNGTNTFALCHVQDTPMALRSPGTDWEALTGSLSHNAAIIPVRSVSFCRHDPRVVWIPITDAEVRKLGCKVYRISSDPFKFQDAVLIGAREGYYGECKFEIDLTAPEYVKLDRSVLKGLFGKFNPSSGDLVFSKTGEVLGIMANNTYCMMVQNPGSSGTLQLGDDVRAQHTGETLSRLSSYVIEMPLKLQ
jgi:hypothetical protein